MTNRGAFVIFASASDSALGVKRYFIAANLRRFHRR